MYKYVIQFLGEWAPTTLEFVTDRNYDQSDFRRYVAHIIEHCSSNDPFYVEMSDEDKLKVVAKHLCESYGFERILSIKRTTIDELDL